ncbi:PREDICTED: defensin-like protein 164 [Camelina sativa]|uniref:Defensin-like protein 164 n=1 Tax=Camelina sativa TaxID=90675 RepID=A0ABM1QRW8_CAMSA|nr:PREDICTED: defensin-like protein 164 [Camelina sativa]
MAKLLYSCMFICMFVLSGFLAFSSAKQKTCTSGIYLSHPCDLEQCINACFRIFYTQIAICSANKVNLCTCEYDCKS